jgi:hypothetical protein
MAIWTNSDGLEVRFGLDRTTEQPSGRTAGEEKTLVWTVADATTIADTDTAAVAGDEAFIPSGAIIKDAYFVVDTAFTSGGSAALDIGLKQAAGTNIDDDGIDAAIALTEIDADDDVIACDGALVGTRMANDSYIMMTYDTAAYTAGAGKLVVKYIEV